MRLVTSLYLDFEYSLLISQRQSLAFLFRIENLNSNSDLSRTVMIDNKGKKDSKSKMVVSRRPTPTVHAHRPTTTTSSSYPGSDLGPGRGSLPQRSLSPATSRPHPALLPSRTRPATSPSSWRSPSSAAPDLSPHAKTKAVVGHKNKGSSAANPEIMKRSLR